MSVSACNQLYFVWSRLMVNDLLPLLLSSWVSYGNRIQNHVEQQNAVMKGNSRVILKQYISGLLSVCQACHHVPWQLSHSHVMLRRLHSLFTRKSGDGLWPLVACLLPSHPSLLYRGPLSPASFPLTLHRSEVHPSEPPSLEQISDAVFCLKKKMETVTLD